MRSWQGAGGRAALAALAAVVLIVPVYTQGRGGQAPARAARPDWPPKLEAPAPGEVEILPVQGNVYMLAGAGGNITVQVADQGVLITPRNGRASGPPGGAGAHRRIRATLPGRTRCPNQRHR